MRSFVFTPSVFTLPIALSCVSTAFALAPYSQDFTSGASGWYDSTSVALVTPQLPGGPDGGAYASTSRNTLSLANVGDPVILFRDQSAFATSDGAFFGNWAGSGIN